MITHEQHYASAGFVGRLFARVDPMTYWFSNIEDFLENREKIKPTNKKYVPFFRPDYFNGLALIYFESQLRFTLDEEGAFLSDLSRNTHISIASVKSYKNRYFEMEPGRLNFLKIQKNCLMDEVEAFYKPDDDELTLTDFIPIIGGATKVKINEFDLPDKMGFA